MAIYNFHEIEDKEFQDNIGEEPGYPDEDFVNYEERVVLDDPEEVEKEIDLFADEESEDSVEINQPVSRNLISALRAELKTTEDKRKKLCFRHKGSYYEGIPLVEINPNKFVFSILDPDTDKPVGKMKSFKLSEIVLA